MSTGQQPTSHILRPRTIQDLRNLEGMELGPSQWHEITQQRITAFAVLTGDEQWIHVDAERADVSEFGSTIAHGLYSLARGPAFLEEFLAFDGFAHALNYGYEKVRFPAPVPVNSRIRMRAIILAVNEDGNRAANVVTQQIFEREGSQKPICVAQSVGRFTEYSSGDPA